MGKLSEFLTAAADILHTAAGNTKLNKFTSAVIVAGGSSLRMGGDTTKQMMMLRGIPVVVHTLLAFQNCERISEIIVVAKKDEIPLYTEFAEKYGLIKLVKTVEGGETRQQSALSGFDATSPKADYVAIHDAARCLITRDDIEKVLDAAIKYGAASASKSVVDTVKIVDSRGFAIRTEDRNCVKLAQTPQIFSRNLYCAAAYTAREEGFEATDDNMLAERIGYNVKMVECSRDNIKITLPDDIQKAEKILSERISEEVNA
ncbi:MAG: 2-C-methyl-D-erythritol 4-phosphate cytidylyltransferase [Clostridia bacterium]|nr:2-C-methyl-D-erythritol 4-phosphate cytidylyltransferase [Clostridia bacterium]